MKSTLRRVRTKFERLQWIALEIIGSIGPEPRVGSRRWLVRREVRYGGIVTDVPRNRVSKFDPRSEAELQLGGMTGGDRMLHHNYGPVYAKYLQPFIGRRGLTIVEIGVLKGSGLAIWCDLFPDSRVIGLDIDLDHFVESRAELTRRGAFSSNHPEVDVFDQLSDNTERVAQILKGSKVDIFIDDGLHSAVAIGNTLSAFDPHFSDDFIAFVEDVGEEQIKAFLSGYHAESYGKIHVLRKLEATS